MNTQKIKKYKFILSVLAAISFGIFSIGANAGGKGSTADDSQVIYQSSFAHHSIYNYLSNIPGVVSLKPEIIYVSQANGPAIHSYPHAGSEITVPWNVEYIDTAYGPAIYSYTRGHVESEVKVLPIVID